MNKKFTEDFRSSGMLLYITSRKSEDLIYTVAEAWKHANSKYVLVFDSAYSWKYFSSIFTLFCYCIIICLCAQLSAGNFIIFIK